MGNFQVAASVFVLLSALMGFFAYSFVLKSFSLEVLVFGLSAFLCFIFSIACLLISNQRFPEHFSMLEALHRLIIKLHRLYIGKRMLSRFHACCQNPRKAQEDLLLQIIENNKETVYGNQFQLCSIHCLDDLRRNHPVTDFSYYETFVDKIANGEKNVLTAERITRFVLTSGTTGEGKRIPQDCYSVERNMILFEALQQEMFPHVHPMQSKMRIHCNGQIRKSECGIPVAPALAVEPHMLKHMVIYSSPADSFMIDIVHDANYVHLLFAIRDRNLGSIFASFSSLLLEAMKYFEANWQLLVTDLAQGTLNTDLKLSAHIRKSLTKQLGPGDPQRAIEVQRQCEKGFDGILKRIWPHLKFISAIDNVNLRETMKKSFAKGLEIYSPWYVSSETMMGLNLWPFEDGEEEYALNLVENVFEFIREEDMEKTNPQTFFVDEVEVGQTYELIFTQKYGLYRYRFGDVVKVSGFYKSCPKVKFLYRKSTLLNLVGEKVDQTVVSDSLQAALCRWAQDVELSYYSVAENTLLIELRNQEFESEKTNMFYVFFLELKITKSRDLPGDLLPNTLAKDIDKNIYERHSFYRNFRDTNQISESKVYFVKTGTFHKLREFILETTSASQSQFKMPLKLRTKKMAEIMLENINYQPAKML